MYVSISISIYIYIYLSIYIYIYITSSVTFLMSSGISRTVAEENVEFRFDIYLSRSLSISIHLSLSI